MAIIIEGSLDRFFSQNRTVDFAWRQPAQGRGDVLVGQAESFFEGAAYNQLGGHARAGNGGGATGQAGAVTLGLSRALVRAMPEVEADLRGLGLLTRDSRSKERKKYGQKGARKRFQFSKR